MTAPIKTLAEVEKEHILAVLKQCNNNKTHAAKALDITVKTIYNKLEGYEKKKRSSVEVQEVQMTGTDV